MSKHVALMGLLAWGCGSSISPGDSTPPGAEADDSGVEESCETFIASTWPTDGATGFYHRDPFRFELSEPDPTATVLTAIPGTQTVSEDGLVITFTPDDHLVPETTYEAALDFCYGTPSFTFTTSSLGLPLEEGVSLVDRVYSIDLAGGHFMDGAGVGETLSSLFARAVLVEVTADEDDQLDIIAAVSDESAKQDYCRRTAELPDIDFSTAPFVSFSLDEFEFGAYLASVTLYDFSLEGTFSPDGSQLGGLEFSSTVDASEIAAAMGAVSTDAVCEIAALLGTECGPCPSSDAETCMTITADRIEAEQVSTDLEVIEEAFADPRCEVEED